MKFFAAFAVLVAVAAAAPTTSWTLNDLSAAIQNPATPASVLPYLESALNAMMDALFAGKPVESVVVPTPIGLLPVEAVSPVAVMPAEVDLAPTPTTAWTLNDLSEAIQNPATPASVLPYLEHALNEMMDALFAGNPVESVVVVTPVGLLPVEALSPVVVMPAEVDLTPVAPAPVPAPVVPAPVVPAPAVVADSGTPLVQIIVNIKSQEAAPEVAAEVPSPVPSPAVIPEPVLVVEQPSPVPVPEPVVIGPAPAPVVVPEPIVIAPAPAPVVIPEPVVVAPEVPAPIVIAPLPIEVPSPSELLQPTPVANPSDLLQPTPINV